MPRKSGPKPKPTNLRILHGDQRHRINPAEPIPPETDVSVPTYLTDRGREVWDELVGPMQAMRLLTIVDVAAFTALCESLALFRASAQVVNESTVLVADRKGELHRNPAIIAMMQAARAASLLLAEFGMTPSSRSRLIDPSRVSHDDRDRLLS